MSDVTEVVEGLRSEIGSLRDSVVRLTTKLEVLDIPKQVERLEHQITTQRETMHKTDTRMALIEQKLGPIVAGLSIAGSAVVSFLLNFFDSK